LSLRGRLLAASLALVAVGLTAVGVFTYFAFQRFLVHRLDGQLAGASEGVTHSFGLARLSHDLLNQIPITIKGIVIEIRDTGCGIDPEDLGRIFEPMFTTKRIGEGVGLGLAICREIIEEHDGRIAAQSNPQSGTVFTIELPTYQSNASSRKSAVETASS